MWVCTYIQVKSLFFSQELFAVGTQRMLMKIYPLFIQFILYIYSLFQQKYTYALNQHINASFFSRIHKAHWHKKDMRVFFAIRGAA